MIRSCCCILNPLLHDLIFFFNPLLHDPQLNFFFIWSAVFKNPLLHDVHFFFFFNPVLHDPQFSFKFHCYMIHSCCFVNPVLHDPQFNYYYFYPLLQDPQLKKKKKKSHYLFTKESEVWKICHQQKKVLRRREKNRSLSTVEFRSCVKVEVAVLGSRP